MLTKLVVLCFYGLLDNKVTVMIRYVETELVSCDTHLSTVLSEAEVSIARVITE